jgi:hypothetical protein
MAVTPTEPTVLKRQFPHVDGVADWRAQQSLRLLWDRVFALEERLQAAEATQGDLVSASNSHEDDLGRAERKADEALAIAQRHQGEPGYIPPGGVVIPGGPLVYAWIDRGGNPVVAPAGSVGAPSSIDAWRDYFFGEAGVTIGADAADYQAVSLALVDLGMRVNATPGAVPSSAWPYFGIHMIIDAGGFPRGRIQLPTATPDGLGYYTHEFQIIADA